MADNRIHSISNKSKVISENPLFQNLDRHNREFLESVAAQYHLTQQDLFNVVEITTDFEMWDVGLLSTLWDDSNTAHLQGKRRKQEILGRLIQRREQFRKDLPDYTKAPPPLKEKATIKFTIKNSDDPVLGLCPVFSDKNPLLQPANA